MGINRVRSCQGVPCVACLNLKTYGVIILSIFLHLVVLVGSLVNKLILIFSDFHIYAIATFWAMSLVGIYPGWASIGPAREREQKGKGCYYSLRHFERLYFNVIHLYRNGLEMLDKRKR